MRQNEKSVRLQAEWDSMDEFERRASNAYEESREILNQSNRRRKQKGLPPLTGYPDGYK
jgi:hypothetical protein